MILIRDLLKISSRSIFKISIGGGFVILSILWILIMKFENQEVKTFDWIYAVFFASMGIMNLVEGFGFSILNLFGKAFIRVDQHVISIKTGVLKKELCIPWSEIESIAYRTMKLKVSLLDKTTLKIVLSDLNYMVVQELKEALDTIAHEKGIPISV